MSTNRKLSIVPFDAPEPPYPADTRAKGMMFDIDVERMYQSKTWLLATPDMQPWLLRVWVESWRSIPVGSYEDDDEVIAARIRMPEPLFQAHKKILMRGWVRHSDGYLYHPVITEMVLKITTWRENERARKKAYRDGMSRGTDTGQTRESAGKTLADNTSSSSSSSSALGSKDPGGAEAPFPMCPHEAIIDLYHETLPELPVMVYERWRGNQGEDWLRARWRESPRHREMDFWSKFFRAVRGNQHWMGTNGKWQADLRWLVKRENFDKVIDAMVTAQARAGHG